MTHKCAGYTQATSMERRHVVAEETDRHEDEREVDREIGVSKPDGTEVEIDTEREGTHTHETRSTDDQEENQKEGEEDG